MIGVLKGVGYPHLALLSIESVRIVDATPFFRFSTKQLP